MGLLYLREHMSCYNYSKCVQEGFLYYDLDKGISHEEEAVKDCILFVLKGSLQFHCNEFEFILPAGKMVFFHRGSLFKTYSLEKSEIVVAMFEGGVWACEKALFSELYHLKTSIKYRMEPLEIKRQLKKYLELLVYYLKDGANCIHFHEIKIKELFWSFRFYYTKMELVNFYYTIIGDSQDFKNKVLNNYKRSKTVKELAKACGSSLSAFKRRFTTEFGETASLWMQKQMLGEIRYKLADTNLSLGTIACQLDFSSLAQFSRYCKRYLGYSPTELRQQLKNKTDAVEKKIACDEKAKQ